MAYVLRLIVGAALSLFSAFSFSQECTNGVVGYYWSVNPSDGNYLSGSGHSYYCNTDLCLYSRSKIFPGKGWDYDRTGNECPALNDEGHYFYGTYASNPPFDDDLGGDDSNENNPGNSGDGGDNDNNDDGNNNDPSPEENPSDNPGNGNGNGNGSGSGNSGSGENGYGSGVPDDAKICNEDDDYFHDCYRVNAFSGKWRYWHKDDSEEICDILESKNEWDDCYFDGNYYRKTGFRSSNQWDDYNDYRYNRCKDDHDVGNSTYDYMEATSKWYCIERYRGTDESTLYELAVSNFKNNKTAADILSDADGGDGEEKDKDEIDIRKKFKISEDGEGELYSSIPDLLEQYVPQKSGAHGVCLDDLTIEIAETEITLEISRVCEWLEILGKILVFISLFVAIRIVTRD